MDLVDIRRLVIISMFSDDTLFAQLALKGGNALNIVYGFGSRSSIDVDLSLEKDFEDLEDSRERIFRALRDRFAEAGFVVFDESLERRPLQNKAGDEKWGGYQIEFKLMEASRFESMKDDIEKTRREAFVVGPAEQRIFRVQISKHEYCEGKVEIQLDDYSIVVYTPAMIAIEKLRAICQQMPEYPLRGYATPRARDFFDIHLTITDGKVDLGSNENLELVRNIFAAKAVDLNLLARIESQREFHRQDWPSVELTVSGPLASFDFYFEFVLGQAQILKPLWEK
jgi:predicted nucleotidyltransferase component of viral defense system